MIYEWLRALNIYAELEQADQITWLRKCALYHTILDPCFISLQLGDGSKFVLQNGGYVSTDPDTCDDGWDDEKEITRENKKKFVTDRYFHENISVFRIYWPLLNRLKSDILDQMVTLDLNFEEFVALKAFVSIYSSKFLVLTRCNLIFSSDS